MFEMNETLTQPNLHIPQLCFWPVQGGREQHLVVIRLLGSPTEKANENPINESDPARHRNRFA